MFVKEKTEQNNASNSPIVSENRVAATPQSLVQKETETHGSKTTQTKIWTGRVSLDDHQYQNKPQKDDVGRINNAIANGATEIDEDGLIKAITSGQSWSPTIFNDKRNREHFVEMSALVTDFDDGFQSLDEIITRAEEHGLKFSFVHESFSHTQERPKYRGVFLLEHPIQDYQTAKLYCEYIKDAFKGMVDKGAAEPCRLYYGGRAESVIVHNQTHQYSLEWFENASSEFRLESEKQRKPNKSKSAQKVVEISRYKNTKTQKEQKSHGSINYQIDWKSYSKEDIDCLQKIIACLEIVSESDCDEESHWLDITAALKFEALKHPEIEDEIEKIWNKWSSKSDNYNRDGNYTRWNSLNDTSDNAITIGSVITNYCGGWENVQQQIEKLFSQSESKTSDPYLVDPRIGTFQGGLAKILESQDYISLDETCYRWTGTYWKVVNDDAMKTHVAKESQKFYKLDKKGEKLFTFGTENDVKGGLNFFKSLHNRSDTDVSNAHLIAFDNGTFDVRTNDLSLHHNKRDNLTFKIVGDYIEGAELPEVARDFFTSAFGEELIPYIRAVYKMYLDPTFPYGKFVHVIGPSGSGKGTFIRLLLSMLSPSSKGAGNDLTCFNKPDKVMQELSGKSIYALPDMSGFTNKCTGFYELVDNGPLSGRKLYASHTISKRWNVRFIVGSVNPLKVGGSSDGWARRVLQLPTKRRERKPDIYLEKKLTDVNAQIASWALQMPKEEALELIQNADANEVIKQSTLEAAIYGDSVKQFVDQCVLLTGRNNDFVPISELHKKYKLYCKEKGYKALALNAFSTSIQSDLRHLYQKRKTVNNEKRPSCLMYIKMQSDLFTEANVHIPMEYKSEHESEDNFKKLLEFDPERVDSDPDHAEI
ncbi:MAG: PriCT-2 domain-containing protein [Cyanobacteria bacterium P01_G01_bin.19]